MMERNPRVDPVAGDVVEVAGEVRTVLEITKGGAVVYRVGEGEERICDPKFWAVWARGYAPRESA